jgi:hypothetical protein
MPTKCGYYSADTVDKKFSRKTLDALVKREQYPSKPFPEDDQKKLEYSSPADGCLVMAPPAPARETFSCRQTLGIISLLRRARN